jgi:hypothetical protein
MMSSSELKSILDQKLGSSDFIYRICLARVSMQHSSKAPNLETNIQCSTGSLQGSLDSSQVNKVETLKLWPALKFESHREFMEAIKRSVSPELSRRLCGLMTVEFARLRKRCLEDSVDLSSPHGILYLIGRGEMSPRSSVAILPMSEDNTLEIDEIQLFDFCTHYLDMDGADGEHCGSDIFQDVFNLCMKRFQSFFDRDEKTFTEIEYSPSFLQKKEEKSKQNENKEEEEENKKNMNNKKKDNAKEDKTIDVSSISDASNDDCLSSERQEAHFPHFRG